MNLNPGSITNQLVPLNNSKPSQLLGMVSMNNHYNSYFVLISFHVLGTGYILFANTIVSLPDKHYVHFTDENRLIVKLRDVRYNNQGHVVIAGQSQYLKLV